jgi:hypothetical protein
MATSDDGRRAYAGYCSSAMGKSLISGQNLPQWEDLKQEIKDAWVSAAEAVLCFTTDK